MRKRIAHGAFWLLLGAVATRALGMVASIITARIIGKVSFGELGMVNATLAMFGFVAGVGLGGTATKYVAESRTDDPGRAGAIIGLSEMVSVVAGLSLVAITLVAARFVSTTTLHDPNLAPLLTLGSPLLLFGAVTGVQGGILSGLESFRAQTTVGITTGVIGLPVTVVAVLLAGLKGAVVAAVVSGALSFLLLQFFLRREYRRWGLQPRYRAAWRERAILWGFSLPSFLCGLLVVVAGWASNALLVNSQSGYSELGAFNAANQWRNLIMFTPLAVANVALPVLSELFASGEPARYRKALWANLLINAGIAVAVAFPAVVCSKWVMGFYGRDFRAAWPVLIVLSVVAVIQAANNVVGQGMMSSGRMWIGFMFNAFWAVILLGLTVFLVPHLGAMGLALAMLGAYAAHTVWQGVYVARVWERTAAPAALPGLTGHIEAHSEITGGPIDR